VAREVAKGAKKAYWFLAHKKLPCPRKTRNALKKPPTIPCFPCFPWTEWHWLFCCWWVRM